MVNANTPPRSQFGAWKDEPAHADALRCMSVIQLQAAGRHSEALTQFSALLQTQGGVLTRDVRGWVLRGALHSAWACPNRQQAAAALSACLTGGDDSAAKGELASLAAWGGDDSVQV